MKGIRVEPGTAVDLSDHLWRNATHVPDRQYPQVDRAALEQTRATLE